MEDNKNIRRGICRNYGDCDKAGSKEIIEIGQGEPFECPECHSPLTEVNEQGKVISKDKPKGKKKRSKISPVIYIVGAVILILLGFVIWWICQPSAPVVDNGGEEEGIEQPVPSPEPPIDSLETDTITPPQPEPEPVVEPESKPKPEPKTQPAPQPQTSVHKLSYGTWKGGWKNGQPHGEGTMTYSVETVIDSRDSKGRVAQPGEYVIGEWDNGHLVHGRWFKNDQSKERIVIGKAG